MSAAMDVAEAVHAEGGDLNEWAARTADASTRLFKLPILTVAVVERHEDHYRELVRAGSRIGGFERVEDLPLPVADCLFRLRQVARPIDLVREMPESFREHWREFERSIGMVGGAGVMGYVGRICFAVFGFEPELVPIAPKDRALLRLVAAHVEAGLALRVEGNRTVAVLRPNGRVDHAEGAAGEADARAELTAHVRQVESLRTRQHRRSPEALELWTALVKGSWGLVERVDRDGQRFYLVVENPPRSSRFRALSPQEARVLELSARGVSGKSVAYALGVSGSAVSQALNSAALKVGCRSRTEVVHAASTLISPGERAQGATKLTPAEREVLALVRGGFTNSEIAARRGTSESTVSNQVASLLRKACVPTRRALAVWSKGD